MEDEVTGVPTGFHSLDLMTNGFQLGDLVVIGGRPSMGKTSFALSIAKHITIDYHLAAAFFSLDMSRRMVVNRFVANACGIDGMKIHNGHLTKDECEQIVKLGDIAPNIPLYIDDTPGLSVTELKIRTIDLVRNHNVRLIMVDNLNLLSIKGVRYNSRQEELSAITRSLKVMARELNISVVALCQLNRCGSGRQGIVGMRPVLSDIRGSGAIEQNADLVLLVHRPDYYHIFEDEYGESCLGIAEIIVAKNRYGLTDKFEVDFIGEYYRFRELYTPRANTKEEDLPF